MLYYIPTSRHTDTHVVSECLINKYSSNCTEYKFPGHPAPPLGLMFKLCTSVESWTEADPRNVAVIHCLTGKGRTAVIVACVLTWIGEWREV